GKAVRSGASAGVAFYPRDGETPDRLVSRADTALYQAKHEGRNTYRTFEQQMEVLFERRRTIDADLDGATERGEFELHVQPRVSVADGRISSYEALIRWHHPERGLVPPSEFIPIAEQSGKIIEIGEWVTRTACQLLKQKPDGAKVSINVSPVQLRQKDFVERMTGIFEETGVSP
ncbi:MAG: EAL domain-containing protein, partial [Candidatus Omnitrophica bacterium]|nr:EAL domain-containing protein [Candidatus Omnitrophota bacterium]